MRLPQRNSKNQLKNIALHHHRLSIEQNTIDASKFQNPINKRRVATHFRQRRNTLATSKFPNSMEKHDVAAPFPNRANALAYCPNRILMKKTHWLRALLVSLGSPGLPCAIPSLPRPSLARPGSLEPSWTLLSILGLSWLRWVRPWTLLRSLEPSRNLVSPSGLSSAPLGPADGPSWALVGHPSLSWGSAFLNYPELSQAFLGTQRPSWALLNSQGPSWTLSWALLGFMDCLILKDSLKKLINWSSGTSAHASTG